MMQDLTTVPDAFLATAGVLFMAGLITVGIGAIADERGRHPKVFRRAIVLGSVVELVALAAVLAAIWTAVLP